MRAKSEQYQGNRMHDRRFLVSATHMCMCTLNWASLVTPQSSVHVCACVRRHDTHPSHDSTPSSNTLLPVSATHMRMKSHVHGHHQMSTAIRKRNRDHGFLASATHMCVQNH